MIDLNNVKCNATKENLNKLKEFDLEIETNLNEGLEFDAYFYIENNTLRWGHKNCIGTITDKNYWNKYKEIVLVNGEFQYVETKPKNNFKDYGFEADFEGEILRKTKHDIYIGYVVDGADAEYAIEWNSKGDNLLSSRFDRNFNLKPIKKEWYKNPDNFPSLVVDNNKKILYVNKYQYTKENNTHWVIYEEMGEEIYSLNLEYYRPATKEEVLALLVKE